MQAIEFNAHLNNGVIHLPLSYQHWQEGKNIKVILLADETPVQAKNPRPIGLAKGEWDAPPSFFEPLPDELRIA